MIGADRTHFLGQVDNRLGDSAAPAALVVVRLRKLASVGEVHGAEAVARVLETAALRLAAEAPAVALDEGTFALCVEGGEEEAEAAAERALAGLARAIPYGGVSLYAPANAGLCALDPARGDAGAHLERALGALQRAMARGPGATEIASETRVERAVAEWEMRTLLEEAGIRGEFSVEYQPIHGPGGAVEALEALVRWDSPVLGRVGADRFIPLMEDSGLIRHLGEWVLREACVRVRDWRTATGLPVRVAVNLSPVQLALGNFEQVAARVLRESACEPEWVELEVTEGVLVRDFGQARERLEALAAMGLTIAVDDFGAGYSSLGQLAQLPVHQLKIDRSLAAGLPEAARPGRIVNAIVALAEALELGVTCEGVETREQAQWLARFAEMRCQGYFFSRPMKPDVATEYLRAGASRAVLPPAGSGIP